MAANPPQQAAKAAPASGKRPTGVTVIVIIGFILSILILLGGIFLFAVSGVAESMGMVFGQSGLGLASTVAGVIAIVIGIVGLLSFYWLLRMKKLGLILVMLISIYQIIDGIIGLAQANVNLLIILWIIILVYLYTKRALFK